MQRLRELSRLVEAVFGELEQTFSDYQCKTGLTCKAGCGACCNNPQVESTVLEMLPLALSLYDQGRAEKVLTELELYSGFSCYHYARTSLDGLNGSCSVYSQRPAICRMFGASAVNGKHGKDRFSVCKVIKEEKPQAWQAALIGVQEYPAPRMTDGKERVRQIDYALGRKDMPINQALKAALEKVLFQASFGGFESTGQVA
jgi:Fe-S-cluster containining protein